MFVSKAFHPYRMAVVAIVLLDLALSSCSHQQSNTKQLTERQRDSLIGASQLIGAPVVARALQESDKAAAAASNLNSQVDSLPR